MASICPSHDANPGFLKQTVFNPSHSLTEREEPGPLGNNSILLCSWRLDTEACEEHLNYNFLNVKLRAPGADVMCALAFHLKRVSSRTLWYWLLMEFGTAKRLSPSICMRPCACPLSRRHRGRARQERGSIDPAVRHEPGASSPMNLEACRTVLPKASRNSTCRTAGL
ncbi:hypothetical protein FA95DRAFT_1376023 [Auriscalpium vulgare]|uniref:Uncharacterized protein n=1 Tax=Auriscalpium vulgare TaxID=40419 RepID=A0ACB8S8J1_9AGAM|nr:hypothetical protein FA95DRAFT_1376023 [Auriscalpium vulgare]